jgi:hypothetical protein
MMTNSLPPGKLGLPLMGETLDFLKDRNFATKRHQRYGDIFKTHIFGQSTIFLKGAEGGFAGCAASGGGFREVIQSCEYQGYHLPKGWQVLYQINVTHQDPTIYQDPERFDPDRFSPERAEDRTKTFGHVPFGGGLRECLGKEFARLEMKLFAARFFSMS